LRMNAAQVGESEGVAGDLRGGSRPAIRRQDIMRAARLLALSGNGGNAVMSGDGAPQDR
jgi:hypothetical protein